jgi:hypothetical protein
MTTKLRNTVTGEIIYTPYDVNSTYAPWAIDMYAEEMECLKKEFDIKYPASTPMELLPK